MKTQLYRENRDLTDFYTIDEADWRPYEPHYNVQHENWGEREYIRNKLESLRIEQFRIMLHKILIIITNSCSKEGR